MSSQLIVSNSMLMIIFKCLLESYSAQLVGKKLPWKRASLTNISTQLSTRKVISLKTKNEQSIVEALKQYDRSEHPKGETLPDSMHIYCVRVVTSLLKSGISLNKADGLRELSQENGYSLSSSTHLHQLVPFDLHDEIKDIWQTSVDHFWQHYACTCSWGFCHGSKVGVLNRELASWCFLQKFDWWIYCSPTCGIFIDRAWNSVSYHYCSNAWQGFS